MDAQTVSGATPLHFACRSSSEEIVQFLLTTNIRRQIGAQDLTVAAGKGDLKIIKLLVAYGADVSKHGGEAMIRSAKAGQLDVLKYLERSGASIDHVDSRGWTPLLTATNFNRTDIVEYLLSRNANVDVFLPKFNNGLVDLAVDANNLRILEMVIEDGSLINYFYGASNSIKFPLQTAAFYGHREIVQFLLSKNANVNMFDNFNISALHGASVIGRVDLFRLLLDYGADIFQTNLNGVMSPHMAAHSDGVDIIKLIIQRGYKSNDFLDKNGHNILHYAAANGSILVTEYLLSTPDGKSAVNYAGKKTGQTPLHSAAKKIGATMVAKLLLDHGADINYKTLNMTTPLMEACKVGNLDTMKLLVEKGADVNLVDIEGNSSLHFACDIGNYETAAFLLLNGANVNVMNKDRIAPLHFAAKHNASLAELLLIKNANPVAADKYGITVLHYAAGSGNLEMVQLLLQWDVSVDAKRIDGLTAKDVAKENGFEEVANFLATLI